jgi:hypothetical protein
MVSLWAASNWMGLMVEDVLHCGLNRKLHSCASALEGDTTCTIG